MAHLANSSPPFPFLLSPLLHQSVSWMMDARTFACGKKGREEEESSSFMRVKRANLHTYKVLYYYIFCDFLMHSAFTSWEFRYLLHFLPFRFQWERRGEMEGRLRFRRRRIERFYCLFIHEAGMRGAFRKRRNNKCCTYSLGNGLISKSERTYQIFPQKSWIIGIFPPLS